MLADLTQMTSVTGGASTLTLSAVSGWPGYTDVWGTSGTIFVAYAIAEYTDSTLVTLSKGETGIGTLVLSTLVLTRTKILTTWVSATFDTTSPSAVSFGSTSANIRVRCSQVAGLAPLGAAWTAVTSPADTGGAPPLSMAVTTSTYTFVANREIYVPFWHGGAGELTAGAIDVTASVSSTAVKAALYELATGGGPGRKLLDIAAGTPFTTTSTGFKTATVSFWLPPGWYYYGLIANGAPAVRAALQLQPGPQGTNAGKPEYFFDIAGTYTTGLPATATISLAASASSTPPVLALTSRN